MQIDEKKAEIDAIKEGNEELIDSISSALEKDRQLRDNKEKELKTL